MMSRPANPAKTPLLLATFFIGENGVRMKSPQKSAGADMILL
jgi:hypothetical protein